MEPLDKDFEALKATAIGRDASLERRSDGTALIRIPGVRLPAGWNTPSTEVLFLVPLGYPLAQPDCFWTDENLRLASGGQPVNTGMNANHGGPTAKLWFSYHPSHWNPNLDTISTYLRLIRRRLAVPQ